MTAQCSPTIPIKHQRKQQISSNTWHQRKNVKQKNSGQTLHSSHLSGLRTSSFNGAPNTRPFPSRPPRRPAPNAPLGYSPSEPLPPPPPRAPPALSPVRASTTPGDVLRSNGRRSPFHLCCCSALSVGSNRVEAGDGFPPLSSTQPSWWGMSTPTVSGWPPKRSWMVSSRDWTACRDFVVGDREIRNARRMF